MCGITGYVGLDNKDLLKVMCNSLIHRGPDHGGYYTASGVGLAMRRLAIIDLKDGNQPMSNETGNIWVVFNGEIYNYTELRDDLIKRGHVFASNSDTETIVHLYEDYGLDFVQHLRGMFGIAIWDVKKERLVLARDRIGEKPLYYAHQGEQLFFGSEIKAVLQAIPNRTVNSQAVCNYLAASYVGGERTFYNEVSKLPPGHLLVLDRNNEVNIKQYWQHDPFKKSDLSFADAFTELDHRLDEVTHLCLKSDVEVGAFLSGGVDSSVIVALMRKHKARVKTFSVGYRGQTEGFNELSYAKRVADHLGTEHHELILDAQSSMDLLPKIIWHYDEPHGEPTSVLVYLLCEFVSKQVKVALSGTGGDEVFYGYPRHAGIKYLEYYHRLPGFLRKQVIERVLDKWPESTNGSRIAKRAKRFITGGDLPPEEAYLSWVSLLHKDVRDGLISDRTRIGAEDPTGESYLRQYLGTMAGGSLYDRVTSLDVGGYLAEYQLTYMDRMSMAHSLEVRAPLCDYDLIEFATSLPKDYRLKGARSKHILKDVAMQWLPHDIVNRKKMGFDSPIGQWFKNELKTFLNEFLSYEHVERSGLLDGEKVRQLVGEHLSGRRDYSLQLWSIISLEAWYRMYIEDGIMDGTNYSLGDLRGGRSSKIDYSSRG